MSWSWTTPQWNLHLWLPPLVTNSIPNTAEQKPTFLKDHICYINWSSLQTSVPLNVKLHLVVEGPWLGCWLLLVAVPNVAYLSFHLSFGALVSVDVFRWVFFFPSQVMVVASFNWLKVVNIVKLARKQSVRFWNQKEVMLRQPPCKTSSSYSCDTIKGKYSARLLQLSLACLQCLFG